MKKLLKKKKIVKKVIRKKISTQKDMNARQELFCQLYATDREFFANGVQTYIEVYEPEQTKPNWYKSACASASQMLTNIKVLKRINELLELEGLNDAFVDKQLTLLITQNADFTDKLGAIREYNKLRSRITEKHDLTSDGLPIQVVSYKDIIKK